MALWKLKIISFFMTTQSLPYSEFHTHHAKTDLNKKSGAMHQNLISFDMAAQRFRKTNKTENPFSLQDDE